MSDLLLGSIRIPIAPDGLSRDLADATDRARAFDNTYRASSTGTAKRIWNFKTTPLDPGLAGLYESLLSPVTAQTWTGNLLGGSRNDLLRSEELDNAAWTKFHTTVSADFGTAPNGTTTADKIQEDNTTNAHYITQALTTTASTAQATAVHVKALERTWARIATIDRAGTGRSTWIDLSTGLVGTRDSGHTVTVTPYPYSWYRVEVDFNSGIGAGAVNYFIAPATADAVSSYLGTTGSGILAWGAQHDQDQPTASPYLKTTTAVVNTLSVSCCSERTGWQAVKTQQGHKVILSFALNEV